ncbi:hypothetical protein NLJ89_g10676 [Agrocybe chaxingu]|uniref:Alpha-type protein kinase domain-containing protein n=1 Tax=Agrocybe chaxingu TaxID=84603 RepID=A0A9W8MRX1_9AGAR|nr:hypothetical protein NLJ89_g10676 [Agrocybe chaxingu]
MVQPQFKIPAVPVPTVSYNVVVKSISNRNSTKVRTNTHAPKFVSYDGSALWASIEEDILAMIDNLYTDTFHHRVKSMSDISLRYQESKTVISSENVHETLSSVWARSVKQLGLCVTEKAAKLKTLELTAVVNYPIKPGNNIEHEQDSCGSKRKAQRSSISQADYPTSQALMKRRAISGRGAYPTALGETIHEQSFPVSKHECRADREKIRWITTSGLRATIEAERFASGKTKHAFRMTIGDCRYAAKCYYFIGEPGSTVSNGENRKHLEEELVRQTTAASCLKKFEGEIEGMNVNAFDLKISDSFMIVVDEGAEKGLAWIVDPLLTNTKTEKFSGTKVAGTNFGDLKGMTCDAFAHFSLHDSGGFFVLVDIQGIQGFSKPDGRQIGTKFLTLFDFMAHSVDKSMGLGDQGLEGVLEFKRQHQCNKISTELGLTYPSEMDGVVKATQSSRSSWDDSLPSQSGGLPDTGNATEESMTEDLAQMKDSTVKEDSAKHEERVMEKEVD